jgi:hypothetical protein
MKNLPEKDFWKVLKGRLGNYTEMPDDEGWEKIAGALPQSGNSPSRWTGRIAGIVLIFSIGVMSGYLTYRYYGTSDEPMIVSLLEGATSAISKASPENSVSQDHEDTSSAGADGTRRTLSNASGEQNKIKDTASKQRSENPEGQKANSSSVVERKPVPTVTTSDQKFPANRNTVAVTTGSLTRDKNRNTEGTDEDRNQPEYLPVLSDPSQGDVSDHVRPGTIPSEIVIPENIPVTPLSEQSNVQELKPDEAKQEMKENPSDSGTAAATGKKEEKPARKKRIFHADVYVTLTPSLSFQKITPSGSDDVQIMGLRSGGVLSKDRFGFSFDAGFQRRLTKNLEAYAGLSYYQQRQRLTYEYNSSEVSVESHAGGGYTVTPKVIAKAFDYNMTNVGVSAGIFYHLTGRTLMHKIGGGFQFHKGLLTSRSESSYNNSKSYYFNYQLSYRLEVSLSRKLNVYLQPTFTHALVAKEKLSEPFTIRPYRAGFGIGAIYHF